MLRPRFGTIALLVTLAVGIGASTAQAIPITGGIGFAGGIEPVADWSTVTAIITGDQAIVLCNIVTPCAGSFAVLNDPDTEIAVYHDFSFAPLGGSVTPLWSVDGFSLNLSAITSIQRASNGIVLGGTGTLFGPAGFDPTPAVWSFSADETDAFSGRLEDGGGTKVELLTINSIAERYGVPTLVKMDLEGFEYEALRGGDTLLGKVHPKLAITTYHYEWDYNVIHAFLHGAGYRRFGVAASTMT